MLQRSYVRLELKMKLYNIKIISELDRINFYEVVGMKFRLRSVQEKRRN